MELEGVNERVEWECRRVAAALGVEIWEQFEQWPDRRNRDVRTYWGHSQNLMVGFSVRLASCWLCCVSFGNGNGFFHVLADEHDVWRCAGDDTYNELMARGLYHLGFDDESVLSQLPPLTAHEKLELRLSLPREFWPKKWLDEEENDAGQ